MSHSPISPYSRCGNCRFFVNNTRTCSLVQGDIDPIRGLCKLYQGGTPLDMSNGPANPVYDQVSAEYVIKPPAENNLIETTIQVPLLSLGGQQTLKPDIDSLSFTQEMLSIPSSLSGVDVIGLKKKQGGTEEADDLGAPCPCKNSLVPKVKGHMDTVAIPPWQYEPEQYTAIQESIQSQFNYSNPQYVQQVKQVMREQGMEGNILLIKAANETITDHRGTSINPMEQKYRRLLSATELHAMARTGIGKGSDINHYGPEFSTGGKVLDAESNPETGEMQFIHFESDPEILNAIQNGTIRAVSINGGLPRNMSVNCNVHGMDECFAEPTGIILGEGDGIAFTYVVTDPRGMTWRQKYIPTAEPGIKTTEIQVLA